MRWLWRKLPTTLWKRVLALFGLAVGALLLLIVVLGVTFLSVRKTKWFTTWMVSRFVVTEQFPKLKAEAGARTAYSLPEPGAKSLTTPGQLYQPTNVWKVHLRFTEAQWKALGPNRIAPVTGWMTEGGAPVLSNTNASRNGIAGVLGIDMPWSEGAVEFGGVVFPRAGIRYKGNGTFLGAMRDYKRPFKLSLDKFEKEQRLAGCSTINLGNLVADFSGISDTLGYEFFRNLGIPSPRTAFARVFLTIDGHFQNHLLGLYVSAENPDQGWTTETFGVTNVALFKPVTMELFKYLGSDWSAYDRIYDPKTKITSAQKQRVIDCTKFFTDTSDDELAARIGEYFDLDEMAKYVAADALLSNYDGLLCQGQNFYLYNDPRTNKFGFIPWDLDHCWGEFPFVGNAVQREQASIWQPWVGSNFFIERLFKIEAFRARYRQHLEQMLAGQFVPEKLNRRIDELAAVVRPAFAEESAGKLERFETTVSTKWIEGKRDGHPFDENRPAHQLKRFVEARARSVREQLDGKSPGVVLTRNPF